MHLFDAHFPFVPREGFLDPDDPRPYDAEIAFVDTQVARLVEAFADAPTLFVVVGDHGESLGDHGELSHGLYAYAATQHVPYLLAGPGVAPAVVDEPTGLADVLPTVLGHLGLPVPRGLDGRARPGAPDVPVYMESWQLAQRFGVAPHVGLVHGRWKLLDLPRPELYDVVADPREQRDVAADHPDVVADLRARLAALELPPPGGARPVPADVGAQLATLGYVEALQPLVPGATLPDPKDHRDLVGWVQRAERELAQGRWDEAEGVLRRLIEAYPGVVEFRLRLASLLGRRERLDEAREQVLAGLELDPRQPQLLAMHASHLAERGRFDAAAEAFKEAALAAPHTPRLRAAAVQALRHGGRAPEALTLAESWRLQHPDDAHLAGVLGVLYVESLRAVDAVPLLAEGAKAEPPEAEVSFYLAAHALQRGRPLEALPLLQAELRHHPGHLRAAAVAARVAMHARAWETQLDAADHVLRQEPGDAEAWYLKVLALFNLSRFREAREAVALGLAVDPASPELVLMDANLLAKEGRKDEGRARFEEAKAALQARQEAAAGRSLPAQVGMPDEGQGPAPGGPAPWTPWVAPDEP